MDKEETNVKRGVSEAKQEEAVDSTRRAVSLKTRRIELTNLTRNLKATG